MINNLEGKFADARILSANVKKVKQRYHHNDLDYALMDMVRHLSLARENSLYWANNSFKEYRLLENIVIDKVNTRPDFIGTELYHTAFDTLKVKYSAEQGAKKIKSMLKTPKKKRDKDYYLALLSMYKAAELTDEPTKGNLERYQKESMGFLTNDEISKITPAVFDYEPMDPAKRLDQTEILEIIHNESLIEMQKRVLKIR